MADDYIFDLFISYKRSESAIIWLQGFISRVEQHFNDNSSLNHDLRIFWDKDDIAAGEIWPESLQEAVRHSRSMLGIWSPNYFRSVWCVSEWKSFRQREEQLQLGKQGLVIPIRYADGVNYPSEAKEIQAFDFSPHVIFNKKYWETEDAIECEEKIIQLIPAIEKTIHNAPPFSPDFPVLEFPPEPEPVNEQLRRL